MELAAAVRVLLQETAQAFHGGRRRRFLAETVEAFGLSQRQAERQLGWSRDTIRKAQQERHSGLTCCDNFSARGRKPAESHLPHLVEDRCDLVRDQLQADPTFQTTGLYCRLSAAEVRKQLIERTGYADQDWPSVQTVGVKLNRLGFRLGTVIKSRPPKK
jgi:hypothetical protein